MDKKPLLTISLLISNRPDTVEKCLDSLNHLRETVPSELILVDTGCGERVRKIIERYTDKIIDFKWCADFAKARNAGMCRASGEWFLYLDDDEWFEDTKEIEDFFLNGEWEKYGYALYTQRNYSNKEGTVYSDDLVGRMVHLQNGICFEYSIHECFNKVNGPVKNLHSYVHHYGYIYDSQEDFYRHSQRNIIPLLKEHEKDKKNLRHNAQLAQEYNAIKEYMKSIEISMEGISDGVGEGEQKICLNTLLANVVNTYYKIYDYTNVIFYGEQYLQEEYLNIAAEATILSVLGNAYYETGKYYKSIRTFWKYLKSYENYLKNEEAFLAFMFLLMDPFSKSVYNRAIGYGIRAAIKLGKTEEAFEFFQRINFEDKPLFIEKPMMEDIVKAYIDCKEDSNGYYRQMLEKLLDQKSLSLVIVNYLQELVEDETEIFRGTSDKWQALEGRHWYIDYLALWTDDPDTGEADCTERYRRLWNKTTEILQNSGKTEIFAMARKLKIDISKVITGIPFYQWKKAVDECFLYTKWEDIQKLNDEIEKIDPESSHYLWWKIRYLQKTFKEMDAETTDVPANDIKLSLIDYGEACFKLFSGMYNDELFANRSELLPECCQVSLWITDLIQEEQKSNYSKMVEDLKAIREISADFAIPVKIYLQDVSGQMKQQKEEQQKASKELSQMAELLKAKIRELIQLQRYEEALTVITQMEQMLPGDPELAELKKQCE